jgi:MoaA/NifB/PqqE/SkfB family radical SAM enzyme
MLGIPSPTALSFDVTYRCNLRCRMCEAWRLDKRPTETELTMEEITEQCAMFKEEFGIKMIRFLGGEPLLRQDLPEIVRRVSSLALTEIVTNGTLIDRSMARELVRSGLHEIRFSIDGPQHINDYMRGNGAFARASQAIDFLHEEKRRQATTHPVVRIQPLLSKCNAKHLRDMYDHARERQVDFDIRFLEDFSDSLRRTRFDGESIETFRLIDPLGWRLDMKERLAALKELSDLVAADEVRRSHRLAVRFEGFLKRAYKPGWHSAYRDCIRSREIAWIDPWGNYFPCELLYSFKYGNCREDGPEVWLSSRRKALRDQIRRGAFAVCRECNRLGFHRGMRKLGAAKRFVISLFGGAPYYPW